jgi:hypothetical protein
MVVLLSGYFRGATDGLGSFSERCQGSLMACPGLRVLALLVSVLLAVTVETANWD